MPTVTFIGGCADGEVKEIDNLEHRYFIRKIPGGFVPLRDFTENAIIHIEQDEYYLEHMVSYEKKYWFYIQKDIKREDWVDWLIAGYNPNAEN